MRIALAGAGAFGEKHLDGLKLIDGVEIVSIISRTAEQAAAVAAKYGARHSSTELGDALWWEAIRHYVEQHRAGDVLTQDLQRAIEQATGRNMDAFFQQWVWKGGHPEFKATYVWDAAAKTAAVGLTQAQKPDDTLTSIYQVPLELGFMVNGVFERHVALVDLHQ